jgi:hypothetical protein
MTNERAQTELAERCENATGPDRRLDNDIRLATNNGCAFGDDPPYTASLDAAMTLVPEGCQATIVRRKDGHGAAYFDREWLAGSCDSAATPALALCAAALRARSAQA